MTEGNPVPRWADRLELGEGARWVNGHLVLVDILTGRLLAGGADGGGPDDGLIDGPLKVLTKLSVPLGAVAPIEGAPGTWIAAAGTGVAVLTNGGGLEWLGDVARDAPIPMRVNDAVADAQGRLWFGTMAYDGTQDAGALYRVERGGCIEPVLGEITVPNGPAFSEDGTTMYLADSARGAVYRYHVDAQTGVPTAPAVFADFRELDGGPDGMTVDAEGGVWIANWGGAAVRRYLPDGTPDRVVELPATQPASVCLGGADMRTLYITTAAYGIESPGPEDGAVLTVPVDVPGFAAASFRPEGQATKVVDGLRQQRQQPAPSAGRDQERDGAER